MYKLYIFKRVGKDKGIGFAPCVVESAPEGFFMKNAYIRFLNVLDSLDRINPGKELDQIEISLLEYIFLSTKKEGEILVGELLGLKKLGSQATLHGRVKNLISMGYIKLVNDKEDGRKKFVVPTKMGVKYIEFMSECLENSIKPQ